MTIEKKHIGWPKGVKREGLRGKKREGTCMRQCKKSPSATPPTLPGFSTWSVVLKDIRTSETKRFLVDGRSKEDVKNAVEGGYGKSYNIVSLAPEVALY